MEQISAGTLRLCLAAAGRVDDGRRTEHRTKVVEGCFTRIIELRERLRQRDGGDWDQLWMGMSGDFELAIAYGATVVRVGEAVFAPRLSPYDPFATSPG